MQYFSRFRGAVAMRKRVYRFGSSNSEWCFTGGVFVTFDSQDRAQGFMDDYRDNGLTYNGDSLRVKWQADFYEEKGKFRKALAQLRESSSDMQ